MTHRLAIARIAIGQDELVVSIREWSLSGYAKMPTGKGVTLPRWCLPDLIDALKQAKRRAAA